MKGKEAPLSDYSLEAGIWGILLTPLIFFLHVLGRSLLGVKVSLLVGYSRFTGVLIWPVMTFFSEQCCSWVLAENREVSKVGILSHGCQNRRGEGNLETLATTLVKLWAITLKLD